MSTPSNIGNVEVVPVRKAFPHEAQHFTAWLEKNIAALSSRLGISLTVVQREKSVGDFNVDLLCEDSAGHPVIIENQLERTDHDHLGKLLTYLVNLEAKLAIWITTEPRPEHAKVVDWLNESTPSDISFFLVKVEAIRIGNSPFAPFFTVLASPDAQTKEVGEKKKEWADRHYKQLQFWTQLLDRSKTKTKLFSTVSPGRFYSLITGGGKTGVQFQYTISRDSGSVCLYIDNDQDTGKGNKAIFDALFQQKEQIHAELGFPLQWDRLDDKRASWIWYEITTGGLDKPDSWPVLQDHMIAAMMKLDQALRPRLAQIA